jgi:hypothetical protein
LIVANTTYTCLGSPFTLSLSNVRASFSNIQWETSSDNSVFNPVPSATNSTIFVNQTTATYYRCKITCNGNTYFSNVIYVGACYCTPTYVNGCNLGNAIRKVSVGTLSNTTSSTNVYNFYNNIAAPSLDRHQNINYAIRFGSNNYRYFAIWIDTNRDSTFSSNEMVASNTTNTDSIYHGSFALPAGALLGQTRMRIRGGDSNIIYSGQSCGNTNSTSGETEDYFVNITEVPVNVEVNSITLPCVGATNQSVGIVIKNKGGNPIPIGNLALNLNISGSFSATYNTTNSSIIPTGATATLLIPNVNLTSNTAITLSANAIIMGDADLTDNMFSLAANVSTPVISSNATSVCSGAAFSINLSNPRSSFSTLQWENSTNNITFTNINGANSSILTTTQTMATYYRCRITCNNINYYSNVIQLTMLPTLSCYCIPTYINGCSNGNEITNVVYGTMSNTSSCSADAYHYYSNVSVPTIVRNTAKNFSITFGTDPINYFAVWVDTNRDGIFANTEMYLNNTTPIAAYGTYTGTITLPLGSYAGQTRMRVRAGDNAILLSNHACGASNSTFGETEDYIINLESPCTTPILASINTITESSAKIPIGCIGCTGSYIIEYGITGFTPGTGTNPGAGGTIVNTNLLTQVITGLLANKIYDVYARQSCSNNSNKRTFSTLSIKIKAKVLLSNANSTNGMMLPALNIEPNFPLSDPYSVAPWSSAFTHVAAGTTATTTSTVVNDNAIIDWVFLELRTGTSGSSMVAYTRAALLQADGDIVDMDGTSVVVFPNAIAADYFVAVRHRNHLGFRTDTKIAVSATTPLLDFTNGSQLLYGIALLVPINATQNVMNGGDANMDGSLDGTDSTVWEIQNGGFDDYLLNTDYNLDGSVDGSDSAIWQLNNGKYQELD